MGLKPLSTHHHPLLGSYRWNQVPHYVGCWGWAVNKVHEMSMCWPLWPPPSPLSPLNLLQASNEARGRESERVSKGGMNEVPGGTNPEGSPASLSAYPQHSLIFCPWKWFQGPQTCCPFLLPVGWGSLCFLPSPFTLLLSPGEPALPDSSQRCHHPWALAPIAALG